jgi:uncharacterized protein YbbC (DUF1343 family)
MCLLEGTNLSEGRGTTRPFELFGAPWLDPPRVLEAMRDDGVARSGAAGSQGFLLREIAYQPTFHKFSGQTVRGFQLHPLDPRLFRPVATAVRLLAAIRRCHPREFAFTEPPYEYEATKMPIDLIAGTDALRKGCEEGTDPARLLHAWREEEEAFTREREPFLLYK